MTAPLFLPWLRRGIGQAIGTPDTLQRPARPAAGPDRVRGARGRHGRRGHRGEPAVPARPGRRHRHRPKPRSSAASPRPAAPTASPTTCPTWSWPSRSCPGCSPRPRPAGANALRPWLVLICVEEGRDGIELSHPTTASCPVLTIDAALIEPGAATARRLLRLGPRVVRGERRRGGRRGRGRLRRGDRPPDVPTAPAARAGATAPRSSRRSPSARTRRWAVLWTRHTGPQPGLGREGRAGSSCPLYYTWTFSTSPEPGDFEALCRRLEPDSEGGRSATARRSWCPVSCSRRSRPRRPGVRGRGRSRGPRFRLGRPRRRRDDLVQP